MTQKKKIFMKAKNNFMEDNIASNGDLFGSYVEDFVTLISMRITNEDTWISPRRNFFFDL